MPHKGVDLRAVVLVEDDDRHHFARRGGAYDERAHQPLVGAGVMERVSVLDAEALDFEAYAVGDVGLQPAAVYVEHLVEAAGDMESQRRRRLDLVCAGYLLVGFQIVLGFRSQGFGHLTGTLLHRLGELGERLVHRVAQALEILG